MKVFQNSLNKYIFYSFSQVKIRGNTGSPRSVQRNPNILINHKIVDSQQLDELLKLHEQQHDLFNFINYSTLYKKIFQLSRDRIDRDFLSQINAGLYHKLSTSNEWNKEENVSRPIAQLGFYFSKILEMKQQQFRSGKEVNSEEDQNQRNANTYEKEVEAIQKILDDEGIKLFPLMNDQEKANFLYQLGKRGEVDLIQKIAHEVELALQPTMELRALLSIFYGLTISGYMQNSLYKKIDNILQQKLSKRESINFMSCRDLSDMMFSYSKNQHILGDSQIYNLIENAAALPYSSTSTSSQSDYNAPQRRYSNSGYNSRNNYDEQQNWLSNKQGIEKRKIATLFRNDPEIDTLSISSLFNSIANFSENKFSYDFYERFENIILGLRFKNPRQLANAFRGLALYYTPSDQLFTHIEKQTMHFLDRGQFENDLHSFSTILYFMSLHSKGTLNFYQNFEKFTIKHLKNFNMRQLNFIFFSFKFSLHYHLDRQNKDLITEHIISNFPLLTFEEISSLILNFRQFEEEEKRREDFFERVKNHVETIAEEKNKREEEFTLTFFWSVLTAFNQYKPSKELSEVLPNFTNRFQSYLIELEKQINNQKQVQSFKNIQKTQLDDLIIIFQENEKITKILQEISNELFM